MMNLAVTGTFQEVTAQFVCSTIRSECFPFWFRSRNSLSHLKGSGGPPGAPTERFICKDVKTSWPSTRGHPSQEHPHSKRTAQATRARRPTRGSSNPQKQRKKGRRLPAPSLPSARPKGLKIARAVTVTAATAALLFFALLSHQGLGRQHQTGDAGRVLQS